MKLILEDLNKICGIYCITNVINNKFYIGSTNNILTRFNAHKSLLTNNCHHSKHLQNSVNKYGIENFQMELIEECEEKELLATEQKYLDKHWNNESNSFEKYILNVAKCTNAPMKNKQHSEETKKILSSIVKQRWQITEYRQKLSKLKIGSLNPNYNKTHSEEIKKIISLKASKTYHVDLYNIETKEIIYGPIINAKNMAQKLNVERTSFIDLLNEKANICKNWILLKNINRNFKVESNEKKKNNSSKRNRTKDGKFAVNILEEINNA